MAGAAEIFRLVGRITLEGAETLESGLRNAGAQAQTPSTRLTNTGTKVAEAGKSITQFGGAVTKNVTAPVVAMGILAGKAFMNFDDSMRKVEATLGDKLGATTQEVTANTIALREEAKRLGATTAFSASQAAEGMEKLALAGWDTTQILAATGPMLNLASAGAMDLDTAADIVTDTMSAFGIAADQATHTTDVFAKTSSSSNTDVMMLGEAMKYCAASASAAGMDLEQTNAILGKFADAGIKGSTGGTVLSNMLMDLQKKSKNGAVAVGETSVAVYDASGNMRDLTTILEDMTGATEGMTGAERDAAMAKIFNTRSMRGFNIIAQTGTDKVKELEQALRDSDGTAEKMKDIMEGGLGGALRSMISAAEGAAIAFGESLAPHIIKVMGFLTGLAQKLNQLSPELRDKIILVAGLAAAIGPLIVIFGLLVTAVGKAMTGIGLLGTFITGASAPIWIWIAAIAAVVAALVLAYAKCETFREIVNTVFSFIAGMVKGALTAVADAIRTIWGGVTAWWAQDGQMIMQALSNVFNALWPIIQFVMVLIAGIVRQYWGIVKTIFTGALDVIMGLVSFFAALFTGQWGQMWEAVKQIFSGALQLVWGLVQLWVLGKIAGIFAKLGGLILGPLRSMASGVKNVFSTMISAVTGFISKMVSGITSRIASLVSTMTSRMSALRNVFTTAFNYIKNQATSQFNAVKNAIVNPVNKAKDLVSTAVNKIKGFFSNLRLKLPKITMPALPHFKLNGSFSLKPPSVPKLSVDWYDKGGIFTGPSVIGVGEKRPEFVGALDDLRGIVGAAMRENQPRTQAAAATGGGDQFYITVDARNIKEMNDLISMAKDFRQTVRRG